MRNAEDQRIRQIQIVNARFESRNYSGYWRR